MPMSIKTDMPDYKTETGDLPDQRLLSPQMGSRGGKIDPATGRYVKSDQATLRQKARLKVNFPKEVKDMLREVFVDRKGQETIIEAAERMEIVGPDGAFAWLAREPHTIGARQIAVAFTPTEALIKRAREFYISPHILVRAAGVKVAFEINGLIPTDLVGDGV